MMTRIYILLATIINTVLAIISFFLLLRVVMLFFSLNPSTPFVAWILGVSGFLMSPFANIVPNVTVATGVLDISALVSLALYLLAGYFLLSLIDKLTTPHILEEDYGTAHYHDIDEDRSIRRLHRR